MHAASPRRVHYPVPLHRQPAYREYGVEARLPVAEALAAEVISLPMYPDLTADLQERIAAAARDSAS